MTSSLKHQLTKLHQSNQLLRCIFNTCYRYKLDNFNHDLCFIVSSLMNSARREKIFDERTQMSQSGFSCVLS